ncbi:MAG TPA: DUF2339 domain-containing protein [Casimicrobiaceae bacterium]|nr:DUF2339 domain-containing protein [Casimicrobiaceae bacterium]
MGWIGLALGALIGASFAGFRGGVVGAAIGFVLGEILRKTWRPAVAPSDASLPARLASIERRLELLEAKLGTEAKLPAAEQSGATTPVSESAAEVSSPAQAPAAPIEAPPPRATLPVRKGGSGAAPVAATATSEPAAATARVATANPVWAWFTGGNAMVRVGIVVFFFGIAFLLSYFAEHFTVPVEAKFAGVALVGAAMIAVGARLRFERRAYGMALIGGGLGVLYLTVFAALELVPLLTPAAAFALLAAIAALAAILALRFDAEALVALAAFGGLLAPVLVEVDTGVAVLFGYVAVVNATVLAIAWRRSWRTLNLVGFLFTFLFSLWWGFEFYRPEYFASVEPFLVLFFVAYVAVPVANALFAPPADRRLDAILVFGVPIVAFALQATLVRGTEYGLAWSAAVVAVVYAALWLALRARGEPALEALAAAHGALALIFATMVVPLAVDPHWTSAIWAVEAAGVYWNACRQDSRFGRAFALLLQLATGAAFAVGGADTYAETMFANRQFLGIAAIALSGFATTRFGDRRGESLPEGERALLPLVFAWACGWWLAGGALEVSRHIAARLEAHAVLAWVVGSVAVAVTLARPLRWPRLEAAALVLLPALALAVASDLWRRHTGMLALGWALYPLAWALYFTVLHRAEQRLPAAGAVPGTLPQWLSATHAVGALMLLGQLTWEAGEWTARVTPLGTAWAACAHLLPLAMYLFAIAFAARREFWPMRTFGEAYTGVAGTLVALALGIGFAALAVLHPGDASPLPYVPVVNPLEITLIIALSAILAWARMRSGYASLRGWIAAGAFLILNGAVIRAVHHWLDVPWRFAALAASKPLQAALTLTWSAAALALMLIANRRGTRSLWLAGAGLLAAAVVKLFVVDLSALSGLTRVVAFLGVGVLLLVIGYIAPLPPGVAKEASNAGSTTPEGPRST